jgi:hypothetical protein
MPSAETKTAGGICHAALAARSDVALYAECDADEKTTMASVSKENDDNQVV